MNRKDQGFTLLEILTVLAIIGILLGLSTASYMRWRASSVVLQSAQQFAQQINNTRTGAKRSAKCWEIRLVSNATAATDYEVRKSDGPSCSVAATYTSQKYSLPPGTTLALVGAAGPADLAASAVSFKPPYGTRAADPVSYAVKWKADARITRTVRVTSILGKVIVK